MGFLEHEHVENAAAKGIIDASTFGYVQELDQNRMSMFSIMGLSVAIMAVPSALASVLYISLTDGGPVTSLWGWVLVSLISLCIAASLAEICSVYPTAGGVYYWSFNIASKSFAPLSSWITGWLTLVGNWTITLSINFGGAQLILACITMFHEDYVPTAWQTVLMFWAVMLVCFLTNIVLARHLDLLNTICVYWTWACVIITMVVCMVMARDRLNSASFVFGGFDASYSGWVGPWAFCIGLLQSAYTLTGYGMVASLCEEIKNPQIQIPRAMVGSVALAGLSGVVFLVPLLFVLEDIETAITDPTGQPVPAMLKRATGSAAGGLGVMIPILGVLYFAGTGALTAASRCTYAFSRDGAIPFSSVWSRIYKRQEIPLNGLILSTVVDCILALIYFGSTAAFNAFTGVTTICLSASYGLPIIVSLVRRRRLMQGAPFSLGKMGYLINIVAAVWICFACVLFCFPITAQVTPETMNYASLVFAGFASISMIHYLTWGRKHFKGPRGVVDADFE